MTTQKLKIRMHVRNLVFKHMMESLYTINDTVKSDMHQGIADRLRVLEDELYKEEI